MFYLFFFDFANRLSKFYQHVYSTMKNNQIQEKKHKKPKEYIIFGCA